MKTVRAVDTYQEDVGYPSVAEARSRRDFLKKALAGATALGGLLVLPSLAWPNEKKGSRRRKAKNHRVTVALKHPYPFWSCGFEVHQVVFETPDRRLRSFLSGRSESRGVEAVVVKVLGACSCRELMDSKRLKKLHRRLGDELALYYKKRTRASARRPGAKLALRRLPPRPPVPGGMRPAQRP